MIDFAGISNAVYVSRFTEGKRRRDGKANAHRAKAHRAFDAIWKRKIMTRSDAYRWLSVQMGWPAGDTHMGMMSAAECEKVVRLSEALLKEGLKRGALFVPERRHAVQQAPRVHPNMLGLFSPEPRSDISE